MSTLTGTKPKDTYKGLIKTANNAEVTDEVQLTDGNGNALPLRVSTTTVKVNGEKLGSFTHNQTVAAEEWHIEHNMGKNPSVTIVDSANTYVVGEVTYVDTNSLHVRFKYAFKGKAYLN